MIRNTKISIAEKYLWIFLIILLPFQDTILANTPLRMLGMSPSFLFIIALLPFSFYRFCNRNFLIKKYLFYFIFYIITVNLISLIIYKDDVVYGRSLLIKGINLTILYFLFFIPFFVTIDFSDKVFKYAFLLSSVIFIIGIIVGDILHLSFIEVGPLHANPRPSDRPRGFSYEPSMLAATMFPTLLSYFILNNKKGKISSISYLLLIGLTIFSSSKGGLGTLILSFIMTFFFNKRIFSVKGLLISILILILVIPLGFLFVESILSNIDDSTSVATRSLAIFASLLSVFDKPFGAGFFGFLSSYKFHITEAIDIFNYYSPIKMDLGEVSKYIDADSDAAIGTKSLFFNGIMCFGIPFAIAFILFVFSVVRRCRSLLRKDLEFTFWYAIISLVTFVEGIGLYSISVSVAVVLYELSSQRAKVNEQKFIV